MGVDKDVPGFLTLFSIFFTYSVGDGAMVEDEEDTALVGFDDDDAVVISAFKALKQCTSAS